jgi:predicted nucleotidyltransferase/DNA-binding XRE family transcriptional regulator
MSLKTIRKSKNLTQEQAANILAVSLRSYKDYENNPSKVDTIKYNYFIDTIGKYNPIDESHGLLSLNMIKDKCFPIFQEYNICYAYLFGSYAKNKAKETSDVDLLVSADVKGLKFYGFVEKIKNTLQKKVDVLDINQLKENMDLLNEILRDGIKIYG